MGNKNAPDNFRNYVDNKRATAEMRLINNHDLFIKLWNEGATLARISYLVGVTNDRIHEYAIRIGLKQRKLKKEKPPPERVHHEPQPNSLAKDCEPLLQMYKLNNTSRKWFSHSSDCGGLDCKFLALPTHQYCHLHSWGEI